ncbi:MAG: hypothetical protein VSS75_014425 [Candidatus Parabeggiatoa sp.]|nr:hypothetical protein [Candidatus Parabeggiatoa sp.]
MQSLFCFYQLLVISYRLSVISYHCSLYQNLDILDVEEKNGIQHATTLRGWRYY